MQTFLPYSDFKKTAKSLDMKRLGKQRVESLQILQALAPDSTSRWRSHPATKMWRGYEQVLGIYNIAICSEWRGRGYKDTCLGKTVDLLAAHFVTDEIPQLISLPTWLGDEDLHLSHRSNLVRKAPDHYRPLFGDIPDDLEYIWPVA